VAVLSGMTITASIGVAAFPMHGSTLDDVIRVADLAMYEAKAGGRDRVVLVPTFTSAAAGSALSS
jgi:diguanylate cyclase (GGDEF)-like protein